MEQFLQKMKDFTSRIVFDADRKAEIRERLAGFTRARPVREGNLGRLIPQRSFSRFQLKFMPLFATFLLVALLGGGTSFAAQGALPGDALYPVKVGINEEVRASLTFGAQAKAEWETERLSRRLEEKAALAARPTEPSSKAAAQLEELFLKHAERIGTRLAELESAGKADAAAEIAVKVEASLVAYQHAQGISLAASATAEAPAKEPPAKPAFEEKVSAALDKFSNARAELEATTIAGKSAPEVKAAAEGKITAAENVITAASRSVEKWEAKSESGASASVDAEAKLNAAKEISAEAKAKLDAGDYAKAFKLAQDALKVSHEAKFTLRQEIFVEEQMKVDPTMPTSGPDTKASEPPAKDVPPKEAPPDDKRKAQPEPDRRLRICPDEWIEDRMPLAINPDIKGGLPREYFILNGSRREITEFDLNWVWSNCAIEKQVVY